MHSEQDDLQEVTTSSTPHNQGEAMKKLFDLFMTDPQFKARVLDDMGKKDRQKGPYFNREYGEMMKPHIDKLIADEANGILKNGKFSYDLFPGKKKETIRQRIEQSIRYVVLMMDDEKHTYFNWRERVEVKTTHSGIVIEWKALAREGAIPLTMEYEEDKKVQATWSTELDKYLETAVHRQPFEYAVNLTDQEVLALRLSIDQLNTKPNSPFSHLITNSYIKIVKWSP